MSYSQIRIGIRNIYIEIQVEVVSRQVLTAQTREHVSILCHCVKVSQDLSSRVQKLLFQDAISSRKYITIV